MGKKFFIFKISYSILFFLVAIFSCFLILPIKNSGKTWYYPLLYYTNWSVILNVISSSIALFFCIKNNSNYKEKLNPFFSLLIFIGGIMISANLIVVPVGIFVILKNFGHWDLNGIFTHLVLPLMSIFYIIIFLDKKTIKKYFPFIGVVCPLLYWTILLSRIYIAKHKFNGNIPAYFWNRYYPYPFTNVDSGGNLLTLLLILFAMLIFLLIFGYFIYKINNMNKLKFDYN